MTEHETVLRLCAGTPRGWPRYLPWTVLALALVVLLASSVTVEATLALLLLLAVSAAWWWRAGPAWRHEGAVALVLQPHGRVSWKGVSGETREGFMEGRAWVTRWLAVIHVRRSRHRHAFALWAQAQEPDAFRRLYVGLRHGRWRRHEADAATVS